MVAKIYDNYGVLAHEKKHVYTTAPEATASISEPFYIIIPDSMKPYITEAGEIALILPDGVGPYLLSECLATERDGMPSITWVDKYGRKNAYIPGAYGA